MERSIEMILGIMAILKSGAAYLPIAPGFPGSRKRFLLEDCETKILLTRKALAKKNKNSPGHNTAEKVYIDDTGLYPGEDSPDLVSNGNPANLAYVIYTSGSTGKPKGVMIEHRSVINLVEGLKRRVYHYEKPVNVSLVSPYVFDASIKQVFPSLLLGHTLVIVPGQIRFDGKGLIRYYKEKNVWISDGIPMHLSILTDYKEELRSGFPVRQFLIGGEVLEQSLVAKFIGALGNDSIKIVNVYGPTECCDVASSLTVTNEMVDTPARIPIGSPLPNVKVYILSGTGNPQPIGAVGELHISGHGLFRGYQNQPGLTGEKLVDNPFVKGERLYRTGDLARWLPNGNMEYIGRIDYQVKVRGFRVEPGEIVNRLLKHEEIKEAVILLKDTHLSAYIVARGEFSVSRLREYLGQELPAYMIPSHFVQVEKIPLTPNGKVDRKALELYGTRLDTGTAYVASRDETEEKLAAVWKEVLQLDRVGIHDNYFELGGTSFDIININRRIKERFQVDIPIVTMFRYTTVHTLAQYLKHSDSKSDNKEVEIASTRDRSAALERGKAGRQQRLRKRQGAGNG
jgi:amino acid adenylation domain-containing protein